MIADVGLGEVFWSLLVMYVMIMYFVVVVAVWVDILRSDDLSGARKAMWVLGLLIFPIVSLVVYLVTRGDDIGMRSLSRDRRGSSAAVPPPPSSTTPATEMAAAKRLLDNGAITQAEFDQIKSRVLS